MLGDLFQIFLYQPLFNLLIFLYNIVPGHDMGVAIIILTLMVRVLLYPLSRKSLESQKALQDLQPKMEELKKKYAQDKERLSKEMIRLYSENKVNPFSSCLPVLIQLPFFIAVFQVFRTGLTNGSFDLLYPFITHPGVLNPVTLGIMDLAKAQPILAVLAGGAQYFQNKMLLVKKQPQVKGSKDESTMAIMNKQMSIMMPALTVFIGFTLPGGLTLYWLVTTLLMFIQQKWLMKDQDKSEKPKEIQKEIQIEAQ